jgi:Tfp pilus assembly protein PilE
MKKLFLLIISIIVAITTQQAYSDIIGKTKQTVADTALVNRIDLIKKKFSEINSNIPSFKKISKDIFEESTEGGELTKYADSKGVRKIVQIFYGEMGKNKEEFYYDDDGSLMFYYRLEEKYDMPMYIKGPKTKSKTETRFYLLDDKIVKYVYNPAKTFKEVEITKLGVDIVKISAKALKRK